MILLQIEENHRLLRLILNIKKFHLNSVLHFLTRQQSDWVKVWHFHLSFFVAAPESFMNWTFWEDSAASRASCLRCEVDQRQVGREQQNLQCQQTCCQLSRSLSSWKMFEKWPSVVLREIMLKNHWNKWKRSSLLLPTKAVSPYNMFFLQNKSLAMPNKKFTALFHKSRILVDIYLLTTLQIKERLVANRFFQFSFELYRISRRTWIAFKGFWSWDNNKVTCIEKPELILLNCYLIVNGAATTKNSYDCFVVC